MGLSPNAFYNCTPAEVSSVFGVNARAHRIAQKDAVILNWHLGRLFNVKKYPQLDQYMKQVTGEGLRTKSRQLSEAEAAARKAALGDALNW